MTPYLTRAEATSIISARLTAADPMRLAWQSATDADKDAALIMASDDLDAVSWAGRRALHDTAGSAGQYRQWPRVLGVPGAGRAGDLSGVVSGGATAYYEAYDAAIYGVASWSVLGVPFGVRVGCAIQAAWRIQRAQGVDPTQHVLDAAARGVQSQSLSGGSESYDLFRAAGAWANLHQLVQTLTARLTTRGGHFL